MTEGRGLRTAPPGSGLQLFNTTGTWGIPMAIVAAAILLLMTCWSFWGWTVGDSRNIKWIRHWCGGIFVILVAVLSTASGYTAARNLERSAARTSASEALQVVADRIESGEARKVLHEIRRLDHSDDPDRDAYDLLLELPEFVERLQTSSRTVAAEPPEAPETMLR